jgi:ribonuclease J
MLDNFDHSFSWLPIGGLGEVGMNCMVFQFGKTPIAIDAGILFADANDFGIEQVHPDFEFILRQLPIENWIITHGHEDHIGAVPALIKAAIKLNRTPPTIWAAPFAAGLIREKLLDGQSYPGLKSYVSCVKEFQLDQELVIGDVNIFPLSVRHSTPQSCSLYIRWKDGPHNKLSLFHSSDFKLDFNEYEDGSKDNSRMDWIEKEGVDFLFLDSTNAEQAGHSSSEKELLPNLEKLIKNAKGRVYLTLFSSNVYRIASILRIAKACNRYSCLAGRSLQSTFRIARESGLLGPECPDVSDFEILDNKEIGRRLPEKQLIICSGSQGEYRSVLRKMALDSHPDFQLGPDDTVIFSSKLIPGNEKAVSLLINGLLKTGAQVLWGNLAKEMAGGPIHASGHAKQSELESLLQKLKPKNLIPVHGEYRQLHACRKIGIRIGAEWNLSKDNIFVCEDGQSLSFRKHGKDWALNDRKDLSPIPKVLRFENMSSSSLDPIVRERKRLAENGALSVNYAPGLRLQILAAGFCSNEQINQGTMDLIFEDFESYLFAKFKHKKGLKKSISPSEAQEVSEDLSKRAKKITGTKPYVLFHFGESAL